MVRYLHMETTHVDINARPKGAALNSLAIVGFVALIIIGILATIYAASFIPKMLRGSNSNGSAAAYLSGLSDQSANTATVTATPTTPTPTGTVTAAPLTTPTETTPAPAANPITKTIYKYVTVPSSSSVASYSGLADLTIAIIDRGYLQGGSFISANSVPSGYQGAVKYRISNIGTNTSGSYRVDIRVETNNGTDNDSVTGGSLPPSRSVEGTGSFDATSGGTATIRLTVDASNVVSESNENNNTEVTTMVLNGYGNGIYNNRNSNSSYDSNGNYCTYGTYYSGSRYYCNNAYDNNSSGSYDSNGNYCTYGTYQQSGRYYCRPTNYYNSNGTNNYDSNGNYCSYGVYQSGNQFYCNSSNSNTNVYYNNRDSSCYYGSYLQNGTYYCY